jgi:peptidoglycan/xylan/chitin deacetylase (PgdA/CDA1 family)
MKKIVVIIFIFLIVCFGLYLGYKFVLNNNEKEEENKIDIIKEHYNTYVTTNKDADIYEYDSKNDEYSKIGEIIKDVELTLVDETITSGTTHFKIKNLNYYISYEDVTPTYVTFVIDERYKSYIVFNENITTKEITNFYDSNNNQLLFKINSSFEFPIIIKEDNKYGIEYNDQLLYIYKEDVLNTYENNNTSISTRDNIRTFTYHTVYNPDTQVCDSIEICHTIKQFTDHMKYLSDNNYLTLTMEELEMFLDEKIRIPMDTVVITLDDGIHMENSVPIVEEYKIYATFFVITGSHDASSYLNSEYARFESHTDSMHNNYRCSGGNQGSQLLCEKKENIVADLKISQEKLNESYYFAYPFFDFNDNIIVALQEARFKMAFIGQWNTKGYSDSNTNRYLLRRKTVFGNLTLSEFIEYLE